jgi:hypothetical protein
MSTGRVHHGGAAPIDPTDTAASGETATTDGGAAATTGRGASAGRTRADVMAGISAAATTRGAPDPIALVDGAKTRIRVKLDGVRDTNLLKHLEAAAKRGVDVQAYLVAPKTFDAQGVLDEQGLELSGVDTTVDASDKLAGAPTLIADEQAIAGGKLVSDKGAVDKAASAFASAVAEKPAAGSAPPAGAVRLLAMPDAGAGDIGAAIASAKKTLDVECYQIDDPTVNAALADAAKRGVKVRVMLEPKTVGAQNYAIEAAKLKAAGVDVQPTPPQFDKSHDVDHAKFMVIDGKELLFGTGNLVRSGLGGNPAQGYDNRDFWVEDGRAESASEGETLFDDDWARKATSGVEFKDLVLTPDNADQRVLDLIGSAQKRCLVWNQSLSDPKVVAALIAAKKRGADVRVLLGDQPGFGGAPAKNDAAIQQLKAAGIQAGYFTKNYLHAKAIVADGKAFVGSQNFTAGGLGQNRELGEILDDPAAVAKLAATFGADESA